MTFRYSSVSAMTQRMTLEKSWPCWTWFDFECCARIMWVITNQNDGQKKPSALEFLHQYRAVQQSGKVDPIPNRAVGQPRPLDMEPKQMPPKNMLLLISQCLHLSLFQVYFKSISCQSEPFIILDRISNFHIPQSPFLTKCEQNNIQSEKPLIHNDISTGIIRFVSEDWHLFCNYCYSKEWFQISNSKSDENLFFIYLIPILRDKS